MSLSQTVAKPATEPATQSAAILPLPRAKKAPRLSFDLVKAIASRVVPPIVTILLIGVLWELLCSSPSSSLPPPSKVLDTSWELITSPFYDRGGLDKGLFWHLLASLKRVAIGYSLAAVVGIALGVLIGQSTIALRGLDPVFQVLRTVPPLAWLPLSLAAFRQADPSAVFVIFITAIWPIIINTSVGIRNIPQDYRNVARVIRLNPLNIFTRSCCRRACPTCSPA